MFDKEYILNFAINLYHTKSKMMVNGRDVNSFNHEFLKIAEVILRKNDVNMLDKDIRSIIISCLNNIKDSYANAKPDALPRKKLAEQGQKIHTAEAGIDILGEDKKNNIGAQMTVTQVTQTDGGERKEICPICENSVEYGICCDLCQQWYHFECETLYEDDIERFQDTDLQYNCIFCTYDTQCESINHSILYTRSGVTEIGVETYPKTLDGGTNHLNSLQILAQ